MTNIYNKYYVIVVKFPFASSNIYKARPAVVISYVIQKLGAFNIVLKALGDLPESKLAVSN